MNLVQVCICSSVFDIASVSCRWFDSDYVLLIRNIHMGKFISQSADVSRIYLSTRVFPLTWAAQQRICGVYSNTIWTLAFRTTKWIIDTSVFHISGNLPITSGGEREFNVRRNKKNKKTKSFSVCSEGLQLRRFTNHPKLCLSVNWLEHIMP